MCNFVPSVFEREIATWGRWVGGALHNTELFATPVIQDDITSKSEGKPTLYLATLLNSCFPCFRNLCCRWEIIMSLREKSDMLRR